MANERREFTIDRGDGRDFERTIVGRTGQKHVDTVPRTRRGRDGHFTDEGEYRRAIERAVRENQG